MFTALRILSNILIFSAAMLFTSLLIEKYFAGRLRWLVFSLLTAIMIGFAFRPEFVLQVLTAFFQDFSVEKMTVILGGGIFSGVFISFSCIFFRVLQSVLRKILSPF